MSSTKFTVGLPEQRNSSRVLKPPGGGHTDIFGVREGNETHTPNKKRAQPPSTINSCFMHEDFPKPSDTKNDIKEKEDITNGNQNGSKTDFTNENLEPKEINKNKDENEKTEQKETAVTPRWTRVPPGGFSSGFW